MTNENNIETILINFFNQTEKQDIPKEILSIISTAENNRVYSPFNHSEYISFNDSGEVCLYGQDEIIQNYSIQIENQSNLSPIPSNPTKRKLLSGSGIVRTPSSRRFLSSSRSETPATDILRAERIGSIYSRNKKNRI
jgi:hypothetical protein